MAKAPGPQSNITTFDSLEGTVIKGGGLPAAQDQAGSSPSPGSAFVSIASRAEALGSTLWSEAIKTAEDIPSDAETAFMALKGLSGEINKTLANAGHYATVDFSAFKTLLGKAYGLAEKIHAKV